jgi:hypothetical protein
MTAVIAAHAGEELQWLGDGLMATFRTTSDAVRCAIALVPVVRRLGIEIHSGIHVGGVHHSALCEGRPCPIHRRTDHALRSWPQVWHLGRMMRVCEHGGNHADPDSPPGERECLPEWCDGCCKKADEEQG